MKGDLTADGSPALLISKVRAMRTVLRSLGKRSYLNGPFDHLISSAKAGRRPAAITYDAFISYSPTKDRGIATALQSVVQKLGKPWYRRRALRLFRDDASLSATPRLWPSIEQALSRSRFLILLASPEASISPWVDKELTWWLDNKTSETLLIGLTQGELWWDGPTGDFRWSETTPLPLVLRKRFVAEPRWIDLRIYRESSIPVGPEFMALAADFAAAIHGTPKEDVLSEEVRQQRRAKRRAWFAIATLIAFLGLAGWQYSVAIMQRHRAENILAIATKTADDLVFNLAESLKATNVPVKITKEILDRARNLQDQLSAAGERSPELRRSEGTALGEVSKTLLNIGESGAALTAAQRERKIALEILASDPKDANAQFEASASDTNMGDVLREQGRRSEALVAYRDALELCKTLIQEGQDTGPAIGTGQWPQYLSQIYVLIGIVQQKQGQLDDAFAAFNQSLAIRKALVQKYPENAAARHGLALSIEYIGGVFVAQGRLQEALASYREAFETLKIGAQREPDNPVYPYSLAANEQTTASILEAQGRLDEALASNKDSLSIYKELAQKDPGNAKRQDRLAATYNAVARTQIEKGRLHEALASYNDGLAIIKALVQKDSSNAQWQSILAASHNGIGSVLENQGRLDEALASYFPAQK